MSFTLDVRDLAVLIRQPGPRVAETVHRLTAEGARVFVVAEESSPVIRDLAGRGLLTVIDDVAAEHISVEMDDPATDADDRPVAGGTATGRVTLVGGGPGDPGLLTVAGLSAVRTADVLICDRLAPLAVLDQARPDAQVVHVGKIPRGEATTQERINELLIEHASAGRHVVRFKGGDNFVFGRGYEELLACQAVGIPVEIIPGVTSAIAAPALAGVPLTHRALSQGFVVVSGHVPPGDPRADVNWAALATCGLTLVILMGVHHLGDIASALVEAGLSPQTPAAAVADGGMPTMRSVRGTLSELPSAVLESDISAPAVVVIGAVADIPTQG